MNDASPCDQCGEECTDDELFEYVDKYFKRVSAWKCRDCFVDSEHG